MEQYINIGLNIESFIYVSVHFIGVIGLILFLKLNWKRYGLLFISSSLVGNLLCYMFVKFNFYSFPYLLFPEISIMPFTAITLSFPILVLIGVRYSPEKWIWKIPFYMAIINIGVFFETWTVHNTMIIEYKFKWDLWDSYSSWWLYYLLFEWIGGQIIPKNLRSPIDFRQFEYGKIGWGIVHFIFILTIFLVGYYLGSIKG